MKSTKNHPSFHSLSGIACLIIASVFLYACQSSAADDADNNTADLFPAKGFTKMTEYPVEGVLLGQGWHNDQGEKAQAVCIEFQEQSDDGQEQTMNLEVVTDHSEMMQSMNVSAEVQVKAIAYEVSGKASYAKNVEMKSDNMNFVAHARVKNGVIFAAPLDGERSKMIRLTPTFRNLASRNYPEFKRQCGEAFVSAIYSGAELNAVLSFAEKSSTEREEIEASMKGSGWGFEAEGSASKKMEEYSKSSELRISFHQTGGKGNPIPTDQQGFTDAIHRLPQLADEAGYNYRIMIRSYNSLPNFPGKSNNSQSIFREQMAISYGRLLTIHDEITDILEDRRGDSGSWVHHTSMNDSLLMNIQDEIKSKLRELRDLARRCALSEDDENTVGGTCTLPDHLNTMYDYNYQILLPIPKEIATGDTSEAIIKYRVRRNSEFRCEDDLDDPGCLTNKQMDDLLKKLKAKT